MSQQSGRVFNPSGERGQVSAGEPRLDYGDWSEQFWGSGSQAASSAFRVSGLCIYNQPFVHEGKGFLVFCFGAEAYYLRLDSGQKYRGGEK